MTHRLQLLVAASVLLLLAAACSEDGSSSSAAATPALAAGCSSTTTAAPAVTSAATRPPTPEPTASTGAAARGALPLVEFVRAEGGPVCLPTEVLPRREFPVGFSGRYELDERGMLFYYEAPHRGSFWMKNTHVDLAIAFVGADSRIVELREMRAESLEYITPSVEYQYAIEAQPGWYARNRVVVGDEVRFTEAVVAQLPRPE